MFSDLIFLSPMYKCLQICKIAAFAGNCKQIARDFSYKASMLTLDQVTNEVSIDMTSATVKI